MLGNDRQKRKWAMEYLKSLIFFLSILLILSGCQRKINESQTSKPEEQKPLVSLGTRLIAANNIGVTIAWLEKSFSLTPKQIIGNWRQYEQDGCSFNVFTMKNEDFIESIEVEVSDTCIVKNAEYFKEADVGAMSFTDGANLLGAPSYTSSCLSNCGNAADPEIYASSQPSHSSNWTRITLATTDVGGVDEWTHALIKSTAIAADDLPLYLRCNTSTGDLAKKHLKAGVIKSISISSESYQAPSEEHCKNVRLDEHVASPAVHMGGSKNKSSSELEKVGWIESKTYLCILTEVSKGKLGDLQSSSFEQSSFTNFDVKIVDGEIIASWRNNVSLPSNQSPSVSGHKFQSVRNGIAVFAKSNTTYPSEAIISKLANRMQLSEFSGPDNSMTVMKYGCS